MTYVDLETASDDVLARKGDFFVLRGNGNRELIGTGGLLTVSPPKGCIFSDLLIRIPFDEEKVVEGFMPCLWQSQTFLRRLQSKAVSGSGLWKIGLREIRRHEFAKPPKEEQADIVKVMLSCERSILEIASEVRALKRLSCALHQNLLAGRVRVRTPGNVNGDYAANRTA